MSDGRRDDERGRRGQGNVGRECSQYYRSAEGWGGLDGKEAKKKWDDSMLPQRPAGQIDTDVKRLDLALF